MPSLQALTATLALSLQLSLVAQTSAPIAHTPFPNGAGTPLASQIAGLLADPKVSRAHWGIAVTAMDGTPIYGFDESKYFRPASNAKLFTTAAAMALLNPRAVVNTLVSLSTPQDAAGVVDGNLVLHGAGDGFLSDRVLPYESPAERKRKAAQAANEGAQPAPIDPLKKIDGLAASLAESGLKHVKGDIVGDDTAWPWEPYPSDWSIDDAIWGYGAPVTALTVVDNQLDLTVAPGASVGAAAVVTLKPDIGYYTIENHVTTVAKEEHANVQIDRTIGSHTLVLRGTIAIGKPDDEEVAIDDPAAFAALALKRALQAHGVQVDGSPVAQHRLADNTASFSKQAMEPIASLPSVVAEPRSPAAGKNVITSPPLTDDVTVTLKVSQNLHAEMLLRRMGAMYGGEGTSAQGVRVVRQFWTAAGLDPADFMLYDGSGLSGHDIVTPRALAQLLLFASKQPWFAQWKTSLPIGGEDGTLVSRFPDAPLKDHLFAKTGTLGEARALSGYVDCVSGKQVIFSVIVDNHTPLTSDDRVAMDKIVAAIAANN